MINVIIVDDDPDSIETIATVLWRSKLEVNIDKFTDPFLALRHTFEVKPDLVIVDFMMPKMDGIVLLREMRKIGVGAKAIIMSGYTTDYMPKLLPSNNVLAVLKKPVCFDELVLLAGQVKRRELATG